MYKWMDGGRARESAADGILVEAVAREDIIGSLPARVGRAARRMPGAAVRGLVNISRGPEGSTHSKSRTAGILFVTPMARARVRAGGRGRPNPENAVPCG